MREKFSTAFCHVDKTTRRFHGYPWTNEQYAELTKLFREGSCLQTMCEELERPANGVVPKLVYLNLIEFDPDKCCYFRIEKFDLPKQPKEPIMAKQEPTIETKTFISGEDAANMTDEQIFNKIASLEGQIAKWTGVKTRPNKLQKHLDQLQADIAKLVEYVDAR